MVACLVGKNVEHPGDSACWGCSRHAVHCMDAAGSPLVYQDILG